MARKLNVGLSTITEHLAAKGFEIENNPNSKITLQQFNLLMKEFESSALDKKKRLVSPLVKSILTTSSSSQKIQLRKELKKKMKSSSLKILLLKKANLLKSRL